MTLLILNISKDDMWRAEVQKTNGKLSRLHDCRLHTRQGWSLPPFYPPSLPPPSPLTHLYFPSPLSPLHSTSLPPSPSPGTLREIADVSAFLYTGKPAAVHRQTPTCFPTYIRLLIRARMSQIRAARLKRKRGLGRVDARFLKVYSSFSYYPGNSSRLHSIALLFSPFLIGIVTLFVSFLLLESFRLMVFFITTNGNPGVDVLWSYTFATWIQHGGSLKQLDWCLLVSFPQTALLLNRWFYVPNVNMVPSCWWGPQGT